jgi:hypothetical protein
MFDVLHVVGVNVLAVFLPFCFHSVKVNVKFIPQHAMKVQRVKKR